MSPDWWGVSGCEWGRGNKLRNKRFYREIFDEMGRRCGKLGGC